MWQQLPTLTSCPKSQNTPTDTCLPISISHDITVHPGIMHPFPILVLEPIEAPGLISDMNLPPLRSTISV